MFRLELATMHKPIGPVYLPNVAANPCTVDKAVVSAAVTGARAGAAAASPSKLRNENDPVRACNNVQTNRSHVRIILTRSSQCSR